jgi:hypothetical protein
VCANYYTIQNKAPLSTPPHPDAPINLQRFAQWALNIAKWSLPDELAAIGAPPRSEGPPMKSPGFAIADRAHFQEIKQMIESGTARSAYGAALKLARDGKLAGSPSSPENIAKRVSSLFLKEKPISDGKKRSLKTSPKTNPNN